MKLKRMTAALLLLAMLLACLPLGVLAADAEPVEAEETVDIVPAETADEEVTTEEPVEELKEPTEDSEIPDIEEPVEAKKEASAKNTRKRTQTAKK